MASRCCVLASFVLFVGACQKDRGDVAPTSSASGTAISASANGSGGSGGGAGGDGGAAASTGSVPGSGGAGPSVSSGGDGGDPSTGGSSPSSSSGEGAGTPTTCGDDVDCWGDEASLCGTDVCDVFVECDPGVPSAFSSACGELVVVLKEGIWAHVIDCLRSAGEEAECAEGEVAVQACLDLARAEACDSEVAETVCNRGAAGCLQFDTDTCNRDLPILNDGSMADYEACLDLGLEDGSDCATLHNVCFYGTPNP